MVMLQNLNFMPPKLLFALFLFEVELLLLFEPFPCCLLLLPNADCLSANMLFWLPRIPIARIAFPFDAVLNHPIHLSLPQDVFHLVRFIHSNSINYQLYMLEQTLQLDDCFQIELQIKKISQVIFMSPSQLLVLHAPNQYTFIHIFTKIQMQVLRKGKLPSLTQNVKKVNQNCISFIRENQLHIFNLLEEKSVQTYSIARSSIYLEQFHYEAYSTPQKRFLFYKSSILKGTPINIYYEIHLIQLKQTFQKIKRLKIEHQDFRKFGFSCGQIFSYQLSGYQIEVTFLQSGITHKIQSIFNLFLIDIKSNSEEIYMNFTHDELDNELSTYKVTKKKVMKMNRTNKDGQKHTVYTQNKLRSIVFKNCYNRRKQDPFVGIMRIKTCKETKLLHLMENGLQEEISNQFKQLILNLSQQQTTP